MCFGFMEVQDSIQQNLGNGWESRDGEKMFIGYQDMVKKEE